MLEPCLTLSAAMDGISDGAAWLSLFVFPWGLFDPVYGTLQLACIFFVWVWSARRFRQQRRAGHGKPYVLIAWIVGEYLLATTVTNLLVMAVAELSR